MMNPDASVRDVSPLTRPRIPMQERVTAERQRAPALPASELAGPAGSMSGRRPWASAHAAGTSISRRAQSAAQAAARVTTDLCRCGIALILSLGGYDGA